MSVQLEGTRSELGAVTSQLGLSRSRIEELTKACQALQARLAVRTPRVLPAWCCTCVVCRQERAASRAQLRVT